MRNSIPDKIVLDCADAVKNFHHVIASLPYREELHQYDPVAVIFEYIPDYKTAIECLKEYAMDLSDLFDNERIFGNRSGGLLSSAVVELGEIFIRLLKDLGAYDKRGICPYQFEQYINNDIVLVKTRESIVLVN